MTRTRLILTYGTIAGLVLEALFLGAFALGAHEGEYGVAIGFLTMFAAMALVFVGVKRYRDIELGGVIRFLPAWGLGIAIALVAALFYVAGWEIYLALTDYAFVDDFFTAQVEAAQARGESAQSIAELQAEGEAFAAMYANPLYRLPITLLEIAPVALIVPLASAALLRNPGFLPADPVAA